jgi:hypothetical protein
MFVIQIGPARVALGPGTYELGRESDAAIHLDGVQVSRRHARLVVDWNDHATLEDLASRNGTFLNGHRLAPGEKTAVSVDDILEIGSHRLVIGGPSRRRAAGEEPTGLPTFKMPALRAPAPPTVDAPLSKPGAGPGRSSAGAATSGAPVLSSGASRVFILGPDDALVEELRGVLGSRPDFHIEGGHSVARIETAPLRRPKIVFVDHQLRGLDAPLIKVAKAQLPGTLIGIFGAVPESEGNPVAAGLGADFYVERPTSATLLVARLRFWLARARLGSAVSLGEGPDDITSSS